MDTLWEPGVRMPAAFIGHGVPQNALLDNRYTRAWRDFGQAVPLSDGVSFTLSRAGHILGSSSVLVRAGAGDNQGDRTTHRIADQVHRATGSLEVGDDRPGVRR